MKIFCIGRNFKDHAKEMNADIPTDPVFFLKPDTAILNQKTFFYPDFSNDIHYECELVIKIDKVGKNISEKFAHKYYSKIGLGIDFTARDLQTKCKQKGLPWEISKAFDNSAVISKNFLDISEFNTNNISFKLKKNDDVVQEGNSSEMIFSFNRIISYLSKFFTLKQGDLIFMGTPKGVAPVNIGDHLKGYIVDTEMFSLEIK